MARPDSALAERTRGLLDMLRITARFRRPVRFALAQLGRRAEPQLHRLRESGIAVLVRHGTPDLNVLDELYLRRHYEPPPEVARLLDGGHLRVLDLGANAGYFGAWLLGRYPDAELTAYEPDPDNAAVHAATIQANDLHDRWKLVEACAGTREELVPFVGGDYTTSRRGAGDEEASLYVPSVDVFRHAQDVDLLKMDIEGGEWEILCDARFPELGAAVVVLEYHAHLCPADDPRELAASRLNAAGYAVADGTGEGFPPGQGMIWAWKER